MKALQFLLKIGVLLFSIQTYAQEYSYQESNSAGHKINIIDTTGNTAGYFTVDSWNKQRINVYDSYNQLVNTIEIDVLDRSEAEAWRPAREYVKNKAGIIIGYKEANILLKNTVNLYDLEGKKIGFYRRDIWSGIWLWEEG